MFKRRILGRNSDSYFHDILFIREGLLSAWAYMIGLGRLSQPHNSWPDKKKMAGYALPELKILGFRLMFTSVRSRLPDSSSRLDTERYLSTYTNFHKYCSMPLFAEVFIGFFSCSFQ